MDAGRRSFLASTTGALAALAALDWSEVARAAEHAHAAAADPAAPFTTLTDGAGRLRRGHRRAHRADGRRAGRDRSRRRVLHRSRAGVFPGRGPRSFLKGLAEFEAQRGGGARGRGIRRAACRNAGRLPEKHRDHAPSSTRLRLWTLFGLLASPAYGGNRDGVGWKLTGFEDAHAFTPPFGYYDRDYPGFVPYPPKATT